MKRKNKMKFDYKKVKLKEFKKTEKQILCYIPGNIIGRWCHMHESDMQKLNNAIIIIDPAGELNDLQF